MPDYDLQSRSVQTFAVTHTLVCETSCVVHKVPIATEYAGVASTLFALHRTNSLSEQGTSLSCRKMADLDEVRRLAAEFQRVQLTSAKQK